MSYDDKTQVPRGPAPGSTTPGSITPGSDPGSKAPQRPSPTPAGTTPATDNHKPRPGRVTAKYAGRHHQPVYSEERTEPEPQVQTSACYTEQAIGVAMLDLELEDGSRLALPYHDLESVGFDPDGRIELTYRSRRVTFRGSALLPLHKALTGHRVGSVKAGGRFAPGSSDTSPWVMSITVQEP